MTRFHDIDSCLTLDQHRLRQRWRKQRQQGRIEPELVEAVTASQQAVRQRQARCPELQFPEHLPITAEVNTLVDLIREHAVVVIAGETGSGKTTQLPKICLQAGRGFHGQIGHTQPRRIAATSIAKRLAVELNCPLGEVVGYHTRFAEQWHADNLIKVMTDGILLAELQHDRFLTRYDTLIIDEAHERSLNIDFLLGYLRNLVRKRRDLKVIITSATIEPERFAKHFDDAPIMTVSGRTYPVTTWYRPIEAMGDKKEPDLFSALISAVEELWEHQPQDTLIFLSGEGDIREAKRILQQHFQHQVEILPLFARLSMAEQHRAFQPTARPKLVLTTNVAETSLTVPGIRYVIDSGQERLSQYSFRQKVQRLPIVKVSQASANQRQGRCGREAPGICVRLYDAADFDSRPEFTPPEILRTNLASVILQMQAWRLGSIEQFPFLDRPDDRYVRDGHRLLEALQALDERQNLTAIGRTIAKFPLDPRLARMVVAAKEHGCLAEMLILVSFLAIADPRERPLEKRAAADQAHARFQDEHSDFIAILNLWQFLQTEQPKSKSKFRQFCQDNFLAPQRIREWQDIRHQLMATCKTLQWPVGAVTDVVSAPLHQALLSGLLNQIGRLTQERHYQGVRQISFQIFPGSGLKKKKPPWIMAMSLIETSQLFAHHVAAIEPEWVERCAQHLLKHHYQDPYWSKKQAGVYVNERVTLYGLPLVESRPVYYGLIDPETARRLFIQHALVQGEFESSLAVIRHNKTILTQVEDWEHQARRRDILINEAELYQFFDAQIPDSVVSGKTFTDWYRQLDPAKQQALELSVDDIARNDAEATDRAFPNSLMVHGNTFALAYYFAPGDEADGITATIPVGLLPQLSAADFFDLVPGLAENKLVALLKALPKTIRKSFVPIPTFVEQHYAAAAPATPLSDLLNAWLKTAAHAPLSPTEWESLPIEPHLRMRFQIVDEAGNVLAIGRDLPELKQQCSQDSQAEIQQLVQNSTWERTQVTAWDFGEIPESLGLNQENHHITVYPTVLDQQDSVTLTVTTDPQRAVQLARPGLLRLFRLHLSTQEKYLRKNIPQLETMALAYVRFGTAEQLREDLINATIAMTFFEDEHDFFRTETEFHQRLAERKAKLNPALQQLATVVAETLERYQTLAGLLAQSSQTPITEAIQEHVATLLQPGFISNTPWRWLARFPIYLQVDQHRLQRIHQQAQRDADWEAEWQGFWQPFQHRCQRHTGEDVLHLPPHWQTYRWLLEEFRIALFAQTLKTSQPVSVKRLQKFWQTHCEQERST